jgi:hypothetical protein
MTRRTADPPNGLQWPRYLGVRASVPADYSITRAACSGVFGAAFVAAATACIGAATTTAGFFATSSLVNWLIGDRPRFRISRTGNKGLLPGFAGGPLSKDLRPERRPHFERIGSRRTGSRRTSCFTSDRRTRIRLIPGPRRGELLGEASLASSRQAIARCLTGYQRPSRAANLASSPTPANNSRCRIYTQRQ